MKIILFLAIFVGLSFASANTPQNLTPIKGRELLGTFTRACSAENFAQLYRSFEKNGMLNAEFPVQTFTEIKNGMASKSENMTATYIDGHFSLSVDGKVYSSKDPCAAIMSGVGNGNHSSALLEAMLPSAYAASDVITEPSAYKRKLLGGAYMVGGVAIAYATGWTGIGIVGGGFLAVEGHSVYSLGKKMDDERAMAQSVVNSEIKLSCSPGWISMQGAHGDKLVTTSGGSKGWSLSYVKDGKIKNLDYGDVPQTRKLFMSLMNSCSSGADAKRIQSELNNEAFRSNLALLLAQHRNDVLQRAESKSSAQ